MQLIDHELRWSRTIRSIDPLGHLGSALIHPLAFALLAVVFSGGAVWAWPLALVAVCARLGLKVLSDRVLRQARRDLWLVPLWDIVSFTIFVASFLVLARDLARLQFQGGRRRPVVGGTGRMTD